MSDTSAVLSGESNTSRHGRIYRARPWHFVLVAFLLPLCAGLAAVPFRQQGLSMLDAVQSVVKPFRPLAVAWMAVSSPVCGTWRVQPDPDLGYATHDVSLRGVAALSADDVWAVGNDFTCFEDYSTCLGYSNYLITHWDGQRWRKIPGPEHSSIISATHPMQSNIYLEDVSGVAPDDVWAVGMAAKEHDKYRNLIMHWDGKTWSVQPGPTSDEAADNMLFGVAAVERDNVWAVGSTTSHDINGGRHGQPWLLHWDGQEWTDVSGALVGVPSGLEAIRAVSANDIWMVGSAGESGHETLTVHWDGTNWQRVSSPSPCAAHNNLHDMTFRAPDDGWAVGSCSDSLGDGLISNEPPSKPLVLHWDGKSWSGVPVPTSYESAYLSGVAAVSADDVWTVGSEETWADHQGTRWRIAGRPMALHWDGTKWSAVPAPMPFENRAYRDNLSRQGFSGVTAVPGSGILAVGDTSDHLVYATFEGGQCTNR